MVVGEDGSLPLPWLVAPLAQALGSHRGHALLVHGAAGVGTLHFVLTLAQSWLCENPRPIRTGGEAAAASLAACGVCGSCHLVHSRVHPDLVVLLPQVLRRALDWPSPGDKLDDDDSRRKPSRQIRVDEVRALIDGAQRTTARGRGKVAVLHPAEALNPQAANALLKTLEEPPAGTRLLLSCADPSLLLPTVQSRCQRLRLGEPPAEVALAWLAARGVAQADVLLAACSGRPLDALALFEDGVDAETWAALPAAVARGELGALAGWPLPRAVDALHKVCHDAMARTCGAMARYFPAHRVPGHGRMQALVAWQRELARVARRDEHPWHEGLLLESLVQFGASAWAGGSRAGPAPARGFDTLPQ